MSLVSRASCNGCSRGLTTVLPSRSVIVFARNATPVFCGSRNVRFSGRSQAHTITGGRDSTVAGLRSEKTSNRSGTRNMIVAILIGFSLCSLCVLCASVVIGMHAYNNHRGTENTEVAQRREFTPQITEITRISYTPEYLWNVRL